MCAHYITWNFIHQSNHFQFFFNLWCLKKIWFPCFFLSPLPLLLLWILVFWREGRGSGVGSGGSRMRFWSVDGQEREGVKSFIKSGAVPLDTFHYLHNVSKGWQFCRIIGLRMHRVIWRFPMFWHFSKYWSVWTTGWNTILVFPHWTFYRQCTGIKHFRLFRLCRTVAHRIYLKTSTAIWRNKMGTHGATRLNWEDWAMFDAAKINECVCVFLDLQSALISLNLY